MADPLADFRRATRRFEQDMARAMARATRAAQTVLVEEMQGLAGAVDHSLQDLADLGHPYSRRQPANEPHPDFIVHEQSGDLLGSIGGERVQTTPEAVVGGVHASAPHAGYVIQDETASRSPMRPRDFASAAIIYQEDLVAEIFRKAHAAMHDEPAVQGGFRMDVTLGDHGAFPAELPEKG